MEAGTDAKGFQTVQGWHLGRCIAEPRAWGMPRAQTLNLTPLNGQRGALLVSVGMTVAMWPLPLTSPHPPPSGLSIPSPLVSVS